MRGIARTLCDLAAVDYSRGLFQSPASRVPQRERADQGGSTRLQFVPIAEPVTVLIVGAKAEGRSDESESTPGSRVGIGQRSGSVGRSAALSITLDGKS